MSRCNVIIINNYYYYRRGICHANYLTVTINFYRLISVLSDAQSLEKMFGSNLFFFPWQIQFGKAAIDVPTVIFVPLVRVTNETRVKSFLSTGTLDSLQSE